MADLDRQPHRACNSLGWTAWHLTRVQDSQIADLMGKKQLWIKDAWYKKAAAVQWAAPRRCGWS